MQLRLGGRGGGITAGDGVVAALEVSGRDAVQIRLDVDVDAGAQQAKRLGDVLLGQQVDHLGRHGQRRSVDFVSLEQRRADVDGNHHVGPAQVVHFGNRHVVHQAAIDQAQTLVLDGRHQARHRHGGPHQRGQVTAAPDAPLAGDDVGGEQGQRQGLAFHALRRHVGADQPVDEELDFLAAEHGRRKLQRAVFDAGFRALDIALRKALETRREIGVAGGVFEHVAPVSLPQRHLHAGGRQARTESPGHQAAHAGAGHAVHRHLQLLQFLQHPDMGRAARAAAAQHQPDARGRLGMGQRRQRGQPTPKQRNDQQAER